MKKLISVFTALLVVIVGNYSFAQSDIADAPIKITPLKPKAQNGANDPAVKAESEKEAKREEKSSSRVTAADLDAARFNTQDDQVVMFRRDNENITMIPLRALKLNSERKKAFEYSQIYGEKLVVTWLRQAFKVRAATSDQVVQNEIDKMTAAKLREAMRNSKNMQPSVDEILRRSDDAADAIKRIKAHKKFLADFDDLIAQYESHVQDVTLEPGLKESWKKAVPSAVLVVGSFKVPDSLIKAIQGMPFFAKFAPLLKGAVNYTLAIRPWLVIRTNMDTGVVTEEIYPEVSPQVWAVKDLTSGQYEARAPFRIGGGLVIGDFNKMTDLTGFVGSGSYTYSVKDSIADGELLIPSYWSVRAGAISSSSEVKNTFITFTRQFGLKAATAKRWQAEAGGIASLEDITSRMKFDGLTFQDIVKLLENEEPGATLTITKGQAFVNDNAPEVILGQPNTPAKPVDPSSAKDPARVPEAQ